jgi:hypothetical protein
MRKPNPGCPPQLILQDPTAMVSSLHYSILRFRPFRVCVPLGQIEPRRLCFPSLFSTRLPGLLRSKFVKRPFHQEIASCRHQGGEGCATGDVTMG